MLPAILPMHGARVVVPAFAMAKLMAVFAIPGFWPKGYLAEPRPDRNAGVMNPAWETAYTRQLQARLNANDDWLHIAGEALVGEPVIGVGLDEAAAAEQERQDQPETEADESLPLAGFLQGGLIHSVILPHDKVNVNGR